LLRTVRNKASIGLLPLIVNSAGLPSGKDPDGHSTPWRGAEPRGQPARALDRLQPLHGQQLHTFSGQQLYDLGAGQ
jgi:hypothetical protein